MTDAPLPLVHISRVDLGAIDESDLRWLAKLDRIGFEKAPAVDLLRRVQTGQLTLWRITGAASGIFLLSLTPRALWIEGLSGKGIMEHVAEIRTQLHEIRRKAGKDVIQAITHRPGLRKFLEALGAKRVAVVMEGE